MIKQTRINLTLFGILLVLLIGAPFFVDEVPLRLMTEMCYMALFAVSLNLLLGFAGMLSFGHSAYFGVGAYATAIAFLHIEGISLISGVLLGGLAALMAGAFFSLLLNRVGGTAFAMLTLAIMQICYSIALKWRNVTGGDDGLSGFDVPDLNMPLIGTIDMFETAHVYWFVLVVVAIMLSVTWYLLKTPMGRSIILLRESISRAGFLGYRNTMTKFVLFTYTALLAGVAGSLFTVFQQFVSTGAVDIFRSIDAILMTVIGGVGTFAGPILGAVAYIFLSDWLSDITARWQFFVGLLFIVLVMWYRGGIMGILRSLRLKISAGEKVKEAQGD